MDKIGHFGHNWAFWTKMNKVGQFGQNWTISTKMQQDKIGQYGQNCSWTKLKKRTELEKLNMQKRDLMLEKKILIKKNKTTKIHIQYT